MDLRHEDVADRPAELPLARPHELAGRDLRGLSAMLIDQTLMDPLRSVTLLVRRLAVGHQPRVDHRPVHTQLRPADSPASASVAAPPTPTPAGPPADARQGARPTHGSTALPGRDHAGSARTAPPWNPLPPCPRSALAMSANPSSHDRTEAGPSSSHHGRQFRPSFSHLRGLALPTAKRGARNCGRATVSRAWAQRR